MIGIGCHRYVIRTVDGGVGLPTTTRTVPALSVFYQRRFTIINYNLLIYFTTTSRLAKELMKTCHNKAKLRQKSDNDTKIEDVLPFPFMTYKVNHEM